MDEKKLEEIATLLNLPLGPLRNQILKRVTYDGPCDAFAKAERKIAIACTARSGSSIISVTLQNYGLKFQEYLNSEGSVRLRQEESGAQTTSQLAQAIADHALTDGTVAIKMPPAGLLYFLVFGELARLDEWKIVYLRRENIVRQAISSEVAARTGQWTHVMAKTGEISGDEYDFDKLLVRCDGIAQQNRIWERFIGLTGIDVFNVTYEEYMRVPDEKIREMATYFGVDVDALDTNKMPEPWLKVQSTDLNKVWEERFRDDLKKRMAGV